MPELTEVRSPIDVASLEKFLANITPGDKVTVGLNVPKFTAPFTIKQFKFGQSNPTYYLSDANGQKFVLRRKPSPNDKLVLKLAHAVEREFFLLRAINILNSEQPDPVKQVPVPKVWVLCEDELVIGYVFYVMEFIEGQMLRSPEMPEIELVEEKKQYWDAIMTTAAAIHMLNGDKLIDNLPKEHFPQFHNKEKLKLSLYFARQIRTLTGVTKGQSKIVEPIPHFEEICLWLSQKAPRDPAKLTLTHGDFKIDNVLFDPKTKKIVAVLDWELCTIGHPQFDLANFLQPFSMPNHLNNLFYQPLTTTIGRENPESHKQVVELLKLYETKYDGSWDPKDPTNNPVDLRPVGDVFGLLRLCVISQGIAMRVEKGVASLANAQGFALLYPYLADLAMETIASNKSKL